MTIKTLLISSLIIVISTQSYSQTIEEAKDFLKQQIELNATSAKYTQFLLFASDVSTKETLDYFTKQKFDSSVYNQICIQSESLNSNGTAVRIKTNAFNIAGIKNIVITSQDIYTQISIFLKDGFSNVFTEANNIDITIETNYLNRAIFYIKSNKSLGERIAKSLYFLCKQYGGSPNETSAF